MKKILCIVVLAFLLNPVFATSQEKFKELWVQEVEWKEFSYNMISGYGNLLVLTNGEKIFVFDKNGDSKSIYEVLWSKLQFEHGRPIEYILATDVDENGIVDVIFGAEDRITVISTEGGTKWVKDLKYGGVRITGIYVKDIDSDGVKDVLVSALSHQTSGGTVVTTGYLYDYAYENGLLWHEVGAGKTGLSRVNYIHVGDVLEGNEILVASSKNIRIYKGGEKIGNIFVGNDVIKVYAADIDGGKDEIFALTKKKLYVYRGTGEKIFEVKTPNAIDVVVGDFTSSKGNEILLCYGFYIKIFNSSFKEEFSMKITPIQHDSLNTIVPMDFDSDGDLDFFYIDAKGLHAVENLTKTAPPQTQPPTLKPSQTEAPQTEAPTTEPPSTLPPETPASTPKTAPQESGVSTWMTVVIIALALIASKRQ